MAALQPANVPVTTAPSNTSKNDSSNTRDGILTTLIMLIIFFIIVSVIVYFLYVQKQGKEFSRTFKIFLFITIFLIIAGLGIGWIYLLKRKEPTLGMTDNGCKNNDDCADNFYCSGNNLCYSGMGISQNGKCESTSECQVDLVCQQNVCNSQGAQLGSTNDKCITSADCRPGTQCLQSICSSSQLPGVIGQSFKNMIITTENKNTSLLYLDINEDENGSIWSINPPMNTFSWNSDTGELRYGCESLFVNESGQLAAGPATKILLLQDNHGRFFISDIYNNTLQIVKSSTPTSSVAKFVNETDYPLTKTVSISTGDIAFVMLMARTN